MSSELIYKILKHKNSDKSENQLYMENHYKELIQHCYLFALSKTDFFNCAAFHGGSCLRIINKIDRFSEDLDFIVVNSGTREDQLASMLNEAISILGEEGLYLESTHQNINNSIQKISIKEGHLTKKFLDKNPKYAIQEGKVKIKIEIDIDPPKGSDFKTVQIKFPEEFKIQIQDCKSSFSGKLHAVLCRPHTKGRDYFDLDWYLTNKVKPNYKLLKNALFKSGPYKGQEIKMSPKWLQEELESKLKNLDWNLVQKDMMNLLLSTSLEQIESLLNADSMMRKLKSLVLHS